MVAAPKELLFVSCWLQFGSDDDDAVVFNSDSDDEVDSGPKAAHYEVVRPLITSSLQGHCTLLTDYKCASTKRR